MRVTSSKSSIRRAMRSLLCSMRWARLATRALSFWRCSNAAPMTMDCSGVRRSWLSTAMNISLIRKASVRSSSCLANARLRSCSSKKTFAFMLSMCGSMGLYRKSTAPLS
ncbi:hypothetical protein D3C71_1695420 [compost metagenome]